MKRIPILLLLALALGLPPSLAGCGGETKEVTENPAVEPVLDNPYAKAGPTRIRFVDIGAAAGFDVVNHSGRPGVKEFLIEAVGPGAAWFDYDADGLVDVYVPDGDVFTNYDLAQIEDGASGRTRTVLKAHAKRKDVYLDQLYRNNGDGTFTNVAAEAGIHEERWSFGCTAFDYDADGDTDLFVANFGPNVLWRNNGDGTFTDVAEEVGLQGPEWKWDTCAAVGDVDGDGRLDLYVGAYADPAAEVERLRVKSGLPVGATVAQIGGRDCNWRGLKAYCGPRGLKGQYDTLYRQREDGRFEDMTDAWGVRPRVGKYAFTCLMYDFNEDGYLDIYVANDSEENYMWQQERGDDGRIFFRDTADTLGIKVGSQVNAQASMGADVADIDGDGHLDIFVTNFSHDFNNMYMAKRAGANGPIYFKDRGLQTMGQQVYYDLSWGCGWHDFDNDGDLDLFFANGHVYKEIDLFEKTGASFEQYNSLFECMDDRRLGYREIGAKGQESAAAGVNKADLDAGPGMAVRRCSRQAAFGDLNNDGRVDILVQNMNEPPTVLLNTSKTDGAGRWAKFSLRQPGGNRDALGAVIDVRYGPAGQQRVRRMANVRQRSFLGTNDPRMHVGLGSAGTCDVTVTWPGKERAKTEFKGLEAGRHWLLDRESEQASPLEMPAFEVPFKD